MSGRRRGSELQRHKAAQSVQMLREVLAGDPCTTVATRWGLSKSSVDRRVKLLVLRLLRTVGVAGLQRSGAMQLRRLRASRDAVLDALERFEQVTPASARSARVITVAEVDEGALRVRCRAERPQHALALYYLPFATGLRPLEVARLKVADYLREDGSVRIESRVRAEMAINGRERPLYFAHRRLDEALGAYIAERLRDGHGTGSGPGWRGLDPHSPLLLDKDGSPYPIRLAGPCGSRNECRALIETCRRITRMAEVHGLSAQSARLTLMSRMYERGADEDQVALVLGIADRRAVRAQLPRPRRPLAVLMEDPA